MGFGTTASWEQIGAEHAAILRDPTGWANFRKTIATRYFTDSSYTEEDIRFAWDFLKKRGVRISETDFEEGNPLRVVIDDKIITQDLLTSASELHSMERVIDFATVKSFTEIGGGYGRMALFLLQRYPHIKYTIVDVPPAADVSRRFLAGKFPVQSLSPSDLERADDSDVFYSSSVMSELDRKIVEGYFQTINKKGRYFYLKDWKTGHHLNDLPFPKEVVLRGINKLARMILRRPSRRATALIDAYRISEGNYPQLGWQELLHQDCEDVTAYSPTRNRVSGADGFFEVVYKIK
jgi:hypothetical protein